MIDRFLDYLRSEKQRSELTIERYEKSLKGFQSFFTEQCEGQDWHTVDTDVIRRWMETLVDQHHKATSVNADLSALRSFYRFALSRGLVAKDPARHVQGPKKQKPLPSFVRENEMDKLLDDDGWKDNYKDVRARTIIMLLYEAGIRRAELIGLDNRDVDFNACLLKVTGKRNKERIIPFGPELKAQLTRYVELRDQCAERQCEALFLNKHGQRVGISDIYNVVTEKLGEVTTMKKRSPHVLRHSFATAMLNHEAGLENIKLLLGHQSLATTEIYTHTTFEQLKRVYEKSHPRG